MTTPEWYRRKADQHYEMAGLAGQDGDAADAAWHLAQAKEYDRLSAGAPPAPQTRRTTDHV